jgi:hypothetical protein
VLAAEYLPESGKKSPRGRGQPKKPNSETKVAERIGVPQQTINLAKQHLAALKRYPELEIILPASRAQHSAIVSRVNSSISPTRAGGVKWKALSIFIERISHARGWNLE